MSDSDSPAVAVGADAVPPPRYDSTAQASNLPYEKAFKARKAYTEFVDPCAEASKASLKCLDLNNYDKGACTKYFDAYKDCKKAWMQKRKDDMRQGKNLSGPKNISGDKT